MKWIRGRARAWVDERCSDLLSGEPCPFTTACKQSSLQADVLCFVAPVSQKGMVQSSSRCPRSPPLGVVDINRLQDGSKVLRDPRVVHVPGGLDWGSLATSPEKFRQTGSGSFFDKVNGQSRREASTKPDGAVHRHLPGQGLLPN